MSQSATDRRLLPAEARQRRLRRLTGLSMVALPAAMASVTWGAGFVWGGLCTIACLAAFIMGGFAGSTVERQRLTGRIDI